MKNIDESDESVIFLKSCLNIDKMEHENEKHHEIFEKHYRDKTPYLKNPDPHLKHEQF